MLKKKCTNVVFLLDQTGSMADCEKDTIGGFNTFLKEQQKNKNKIKFWLTLFNTNKIEKRYIGVDIKNVEQLSNDNYIPSHMTPLWDAIGNTIQEFSNEKNVLFIILTDGEENSSREFKTEAIKKMIKEKEEKFNWKFLYLGVDLKDFTDAINIGITMNFTGLKKDTKGIYTALSNTVDNFSNTGDVKYKH